MAENPVLTRKQAKKQSQAIDKALKVEKEKLESEIKLLLLGPGESGKSTFFKQIKILTSNFSSAERDYYKVLILKNLILQMQQLLKNMDSQLPAELQDPAATILKIQSGESTELSSEVTSCIKMCWTNPDCQRTYENRGLKYHLNDSADFFFTNIDRIVRPEYEPTDEDILRIRIRTTGIEEANFCFKDFSFRLIDVGGQKTERRKWIHCFEGVTAVLYFVALNEYDMTLREDPTKNRMIDALELFEEMCNLQWFRTVTFILLLNKLDLFRKKIESKSLTLCFPTYKGGKNFSAATEYLKRKFLKVNKSAHNIFVHFMVAVDTDNVKLVFEATTKALISLSVSKHYGIGLDDEDLKGMI